jgi:bifunctional DNA-binding transcriptional regulator/antitoxin component of YhaV-PrlF toxin-antitoxin module
MSEKVLKVGKKGEIFTSKELRASAKITEGGKVKARVVDNKLIIESIPSIEELLANPVLAIGVKRAERLSEEAQRKEGIYG